jgi:hypothetical protein
MREFVVDTPGSRIPPSAENPFNFQSETVRCLICDQPLSLESANSDEYGRPVHEECYVLKTRLKLATTPPAA